MRCIHCLIVLLFLSVAPMMKAQDQAEKKYRLTNVNNDFSFSSLSFVDPYLSPLTYSGAGLGYKYSEQRFLSEDKTHLSTLFNYDLVMGLTSNPQATASMLYFGGNVDWGMHYHIQAIDHVTVLLGGLADVGYGYKYNSRNVNNPFNMDLFTNLNFSTIIRYDIPTRWRMLHLTYTVKIPVVGCMYVPMQGATYFEMFDLGSLNNVMHFSSLHNKVGWEGSFMLEIPLYKSVMRFGIANSELKYQANDMIFVQNKYSVVFGYAYEMYKFKGRQNPAPGNFLSTKKVYPEK